MNGNKIKSKIAALLAKAQGTDNEHEAELFLSKVHEMLEQHQLDLGDIVDADDPVKHHPGLDGTKWVASWQRSLYRNLGMFYGCRSVQVMLAKGYRQELVGRESAIITTEAMYPWIKGECNRLGRALAKESGRTPAYEARRVGNALVSRLAALINANKPKTETAKTQVARNALVTTDRGQQVMAQVYGDLDKGRRTRSRTNAAAREAAAGIGLHRQAGGAHRERLPAVR